MIRALALCWLALASPSQDPTPESAPRPDDREALQQRMLKLVRDVELNLRAIDVQLSDAAAGDAPLEVRDSGLAQLLQQTQQKSRDVVRDIDAILDLARQLTPPSQQGGSGSQNQSQRPEGEAPNQPQQGQPRDGRMQREQTPEQRPSGQPQGEQPHDPRAADEQTPQQRSGDQLPPRPPPGKQILVNDSAQSWGELPDLVREVFNAQGSSDLPVHYREWIDGYWERLRATTR